MPRLPSAEDLGQRPTPSGRGSISRLQLSTPRMGQEAQANIQLGQEVKGLGDTLFVLGMEEKKRMDSARTEDAFTNYQNSTLELEYGQEKGFVNILGGDAVKRPLVEEYRTQRETIAKGIRDGLANDDQRIAFDKRAQIVDRQFDARLYRHISDQSRAFQGMVYEGVKATERQAAALNWDQPGQIEMSILRTNMEIERKGRMDGMPPEAVSTLKTIAETQIHADVVTQMLMTGKDKAASAYYNTVKDRLTPEAIVVLGSKVDTASVEGEAIRGADVVWDALGPKSPNDPVRLDIMETWLRDKYADNPKEMKAAIQDLRSRAVAHNDGQQEFTASNQAKVLSAFHDGAQLRDIQKMPEYQSMDGEARVKMRDYMVNRGWTEQQHARSEAQYREGEKAAAGFSKYWELSNPRVLSSLSEAQILSLEPVLGRTLTEDLMQGKRKLNSPENIKAATIDDELFKVLASEAGLKPYEKNPASDKKEYLGRLRNEVEASIDVAQRQTGRALNREEKEKLMRSMIDKKVMVDEWGKDPSLPAPVVRPEQRSKIYVPLQEIDQQWLKGAINYMRSNGNIPLDWTDDKAKQAMRGRLERAYAISITGGSSDEGRKALEGADK